MSEKTMALDEVISTPFAEYDNRAAYAEFLRPLVDQLFDHCERLGIPMFFAVGGYQNKDGTSALIATVHMTGVESTPAQLMAAESMARCDIDNANTIMGADYLRTVAARARIESEAAVTRH